MLRRHVVVSTWVVNFLLSGIVKVRVVVSFERIGEVSNVYRRELAHVLSLGECARRFASFNRLSVRLRAILGLILLVRQHSHFFPFDNVLRKSDCVSGIRVLLKLDVAKP